MLKKNSRRGKTAEVTEMNSEFCFVIVALPLSESVGCRHLEEAINNKQEPAITTTRQLVQAGQTKQKGQPVHQLGSRCRLANQKSFTQLRKVPRHCSRYQEAQRGQPKRPETHKGPRGGEKSPEGAQRGGPTGGQRERAQDGQGESIVPCDAEQWLRAERSPQGATKRGTDGAPRRGGAPRGTNSSCAKKKQPRARKE